MLSNSNNELVARKHRGLFVILSDDLLVLFLGTKNFGDEITLVEVDELVERKSANEIGATHYDIQLFGLKLAEELKGLELQKIRNIKLFFPSSQNQEEWGELFEFRDGKFFCKKDAEALKLLYGRYIEFCKEYPLPCVRRAAKAVKLNA